MIINIFAKTATTVTLCPHFGYKTQTKNISFRHFNIMLYINLSYRNIGSFYDIHNIQTSDWYNLVNTYWKLSRNQRDDSSLKTDS